MLYSNELFNIFSSVSSSGISLGIEAAFKRRLSGVRAAFEQCLSGALDSSGIQATFLAQFSAYFQRVFHAELKRCLIGFKRCLSDA